MLKKRYLLLLLVIALLSPFVNGAGCTGGDNTAGNAEGSQDAEIFPGGGGAPAQCDTPQDFQEAIASSTG